MFILLVGKNLDELDPLADRTYVMVKGRMVWDGAISELLDANHLRLQYLGV